VTALLGKMAWIEYVLVHSAHLEDHFECFHSGVFCLLVRGLALGIESIRGVLELLDIAEGAELYTLLHIHIFISPCIIVLESGHAVEEADCFMLQAYF